MHKKLCTIYAIKYESFNQRLISKKNTKGNINEEGRVFEQMLFAGKNFFIDHVDTEKNND